MLTGLKGQLAIKVFGNDLEVLSKQAEAVKEVLSTVRGVADLQIEQLAGVPGPRADRRRPDRAGRRGGAGRGRPLPCRDGGMVRDHKGVNLPRTTLRLPILTEKDREDLHFGLRHGVDYVGVSFVRSAADLLEVREVINEFRSDVQVVAKLERPEALGRLDEILNATAAVMVARGDLGVEVPLEEVPIAQKEILRKARLARTPVIVATQMLESMVASLRPTRAEVSDVANAVLDGTDAVMLSAESATGAYPVEAVRVLDRIIRRTEAAFPPQTMDRPRRGEVSFPQAISDSASFAAPGAQGPRDRGLHPVGLHRAAHLPGPAAGPHRRVHAQRARAAAAGPRLGRHPAADQVADARSTRW